MTHREQILAAAQLVQAAEQDMEKARMVLDERHRLLLDALAAANDDGAPLREIAPMVGMSAATLCRRLKSTRPSDDTNPLDRPVEAL